VIGDLYSLIAKLCGREDLKAEWNINSRTQEINRLAGDSAKARKEFDWAPTVSLEDGLKRTIDWWKNHPELWQEEQEVVGQTL